MTALWSKQLTLQSCFWPNEYAATTVVGTGPRNSSIIILTLLSLARESNVAGIQPKRETEG